MPVYRNAKEMPTNLNGILELNYLFLNRHKVLLQFALELEKNEIVGCGYHFIGLQDFLPSRIQFESKLGVLASVCLKKEM